jgi:acetyl-CoA acyltransferase
MNEVVIVSACRTPIGKSPRGSLRELRPDDLAAIVLSEALRRAPGISPSEIDDVVLGCATPEQAAGLDLARLAALRAGLPDSVPGVTLNRFCASGLEAIATGAAKIATGQAEVVLAGGAESMSLVPFMGEDTLRINPALPPKTYLSMGEAVEDLAVEFGVTRQQSDELALASQQKAAAAQSSGKFIEEIVAVDGLLSADEGIRAETTLEGLSGLKTPFREGGVISAGNASQRSDGAAALLLTTPERAAKAGLTPLARFTGYATAAVEPHRFGIGPAYAVPKLLQKTGLTLDDIDLIEFNEAFAAQVLASQAVFPLPLEKVNVNGGAIALGHPLGATGARQAVTLIHEARRRGSKRGIVTMCAALGMGAAGLFEF